MEVLSGQIVSHYQHQLLEGDSSQQATLVPDNQQMCGSTQEIMFNLGGPETRALNDKAYKQQSQLLNKGCDCVWRGERERTTYFLSVFF